MKPVFIKNGFCSGCKSQCGNSILVSENCSRSHLWALSSTGIVEPKPRQSGKTSNIIALVSEHSKTASWCFVLFPIRSLMSRVKANLVIGASNITFETVYNLPRFGSGYGNRVKLFLDEVDPVKYEEKLKVWCSFGEVIYGAWTPREMEHA